MYAADRDQYLLQQVETATPAMLTLMLFNAAVAKTQRSTFDIEAGDFHEARQALMNAQEIVLELRFTLNHEAGGEIARNLDRLYQFTYSKLLHASIHRDASAAADALKVLVDLRDGWEQACLAPLAAK
jgi:flagellar protein FliS